MFLLSKEFAAARRVPEDFGYRHLRFKFQGDPVDVIVISKPGEQRIPKPLLLFCQGDSAAPVIVYENNKPGCSLPFPACGFTDDYHVVIIGKPFIPVIESAGRLDPDGIFYEPGGSRRLPKGFSCRHYLNYYVFRNQSILKQLSSERWIRSNGLVLAGSGEGSVIACKVASHYSKVSKLIYASANPYGPLLPAQSQDNHDSIRQYWENLVNGNENDCGGSTLPKSIVSFSVPHKDLLFGLHIPILVTYSSKDDAAPFLRLFQAESILAGQHHLFHRTVKTGCTNFCEPQHQNTISRNAESHMAADEWKKWLVETKDRIYSSSPSSSSDTSVS